MGKPDNQGGGYCPSSKLDCKHEMALLCQSKIKKTAKYCQDVYNIYNTSASANWKSNNEDYLYII